MRENDCVFCDECVSLADSFNIEDLVKIEEDDFVFEIETTGSLTSDEIIASAFDRMNEILRNLEEGLEKFNYLDK